MLGANANVALTVRSLYGTQEISCTISTRETLAAARLVADGWSSLEAMELTFLPLTLRKTHVQ